MSPARRRELDRELADRRRRRNRRRHRSAKKRPALVLLLLLLGAAVTVAGVGGAGVYAFGGSCDLNSLRPVAAGQNSLVYASDNSLLGVIPSERNRQPVALGQISPWMRKATIAIEDKRFYEHGGIDVEGIARALWKNVSAGEVVEGGSTITQQLVRNLYISRERTVERKLKEACLAIKLNDRWSKDRILAEYLNIVFYGNLAYGIEAAAQTYYSKQASELTLTEAALLAGLPQSPSLYEPFHNPDRARVRRDQVLRAMFGLGQITRAQLDRAVAQKDLRLKPGRLYQTIREPYFFSYVRDKLIDEYGVATVHTGGLKVYTTINPRWQRAAEAAIRKHLPYRDDPAAALVSIDPRNGAIRAMTAVTPGRKKNQYNLISQMTRQSGSTFKTMVLTAAVAEGMDPDSTSYLSAPFYYRPSSDGDCEDGSWWCVETYSKSYIGYTSVTRATLSSDNTVYAQLTLDVGPEKVAAMSRRLGVETNLSVNGSYVPSIGLGAMEVSPLDLASAYATLAAGGIRSEPMAIRKVVLANGKTDESAGWGVPKRTRAVADWVAAEVTKVLAANMTGGTGTTAYFGRPAAGKTGTTEEHSDAWFAGYTPTLQTTVWVGYTRGKIPMTNVHGISVAGSTFPSYIWHDFMVAAVGNAPYREFPEPRTEPRFVSWDKGEYGRSFGYTYDPSSSSASDDSDEEEAEEEKAEKEPEPPATPDPTPEPQQPEPDTKPEPEPTPPPPTTEAPPPPPTEPPPPTTETPPPPPPAEPTSPPATAP